MMKHGVVSIAFALVSVLAGCANVRPWNEFSSNLYSTNLLFKMHESPTESAVMVLPRDPRESHDYSLHADLHTALTDKEEDDSLLIVRNVAVIGALTIDRGAVVRGTNAYQWLSSRTAPAKGPVMRTTALSDVYRRPETDEEREERRRRDLPVSKLLHEPTVSIDTLRIARSGNVELIGLVLTARGKAGVIINEGTVQINNCLMKNVRIVSSGGSVVIRESIIEGWGGDTAVAAVKTGLTFQDVQHNPGNGNPVVHAKSGTVLLQHTWTPAMRYSVEGTVLDAQRAHVHDIRAVNGGSIYHGGLKVSSTNDGIWADSTVDVQGRGSFAVSTHADREAVRLKKQREEEQKLHAEEEKRRAEEQKKIAEEQRREQERRQAEEESQRQAASEQAEEEEKRALAKKYAFPSLAAARKWFIHHMFETEKNGSRQYLLRLQRDTKYFWWHMVDDEIEEEYATNYKLVGVELNTIKFELQWRAEKVIEEVTRVGPDKLEYKGQIYTKRR